MHPHFGLKLLTYIHVALKCRLHEQQPSICFSSVPFIQINKSLTSDYVSSIFIISIPAKFTLTTMWGFLPVKCGIYTITDSLFYDPCIIRFSQRCQSPSPRLNAHFPPEGLSTPPHNWKVPLPLIMTQGVQAILMDLGSMESPTLVKGENFIIKISKLEF